MRFAILFAIVLLAACQTALGNPLTSSTAKITKQTIEFGGKKRVYYLYVPENVGSKPPLIVTLHGSGRDGMSLVEKWKDIADKEGFILAGPNSMNSAMWSSTDDSADFLREIVEQLKGKYSIDPKRVFLFGHSAGAIYALNLSMSESEYFAATAVHAGSWRSDEELSYVRLAKRKTPIAIFVGDVDQYFPIDSVKKTEELLKSNQFPVQVTVMKGHSHWYYDLAPDINRNAWAFLKQHSLNAEPKFTQYVTTQNAKQVNASIDELNAIRTKVNELLKQLTDKERILNGKDFKIDREAIRAIAKEQVELATQAGSLERQAAQKAEQLSKSNLTGGLKEFFAQVTKIEQKRIELFDTFRQSAEIWMTEDVFNTIVSKRNPLILRIQQLQDEAAELDLKLAEMQTGKR
ncbi:MAG TPA: dienelactone hydrolase family protein [Pyrinomonadaceae bacterium]|nr:dienelactone hydrolase family protein [Pyrinomonadaceae bacterium]